jgi:hypothetical protein
MGGMGSSMGSGIGGMGSSMGLGMGGMGSSMGYGMGGMGSSMGYGMGGMGSSMGYGMGGMVGGGVEPVCNPTLGAAGSLAGTAAGVKSGNFMLAQIGQNLGSQLGKCSAKQLEEMKANEAYRQGAITTTMKNIDSVNLETQKKGERAEQESQRLSQLILHREQIGQQDRARRDQLHSGDIQNMRSNFAAQNVLDEQSHAKIQNVQLSHLSELQKAQTNREAQNLAIDLQRKNEFDNYNKQRRESGLQSIEKSSKAQTDNSNQLLSTMLTNLKT